MEEFNLWQRFLKKVYCLNFLIEVTLFCYKFCLKLQFKLYSFYCTMKWNWIILEDFWLNSKVYSSHWNKDGIKLHKVWAFSQYHKSIFFRLNREAKAKDCISLIFFTNCWVLFLVKIMRLDWLIHNFW